MSFAQLTGLLVWVVSSGLVFLVFYRLFGSIKKYIWFVAASMVITMGWALAPDCMCTDALDRLLGELLISVVVSVVAAAIVAVVLKKVAPDIQQNRKRR